MSCGLRLAASAGLRFDIIEFADLKFTASLRNTVPVARVTVVVRWPFSILHIELWILHECYGIPYLLLLMEY